MKNLALTKIEAFNGITCEIETTLTSLLNDLGTIPEDIMGELSEQSLAPTGPLVFAYLGECVDMTSPIKVKVIAPVESIDNYKGKFKAEIIEEIEAYEKEYVGNLMEIGPKGYEPMMKILGEAGLKPTIQCREVYTKWVSPESMENEIQIQIEVK